MRKYAFKRLLGLCRARKASANPIKSAVIESPVSANDGRGPAVWLVLAGLLLIAAIFIGTGSMVEQFRRHAVSNFKRELKNTSLLLAQHVDQKLAELNRVENSIAARVSAAAVDSGGDFARKMSGRDVYQMLADTTAALSYVEDVSLVAADGATINSSRSWPAPPANVADAQYFNVLKSNPQTSTYVSRPLPSRSGAWIVVFAHKLVAPNGAFLGVVAGRVRLDYFERFFGVVSNGENSSYALFRNDGILLMRYPRIAPAVGNFFPAGLAALNERQDGMVRLIGKMDGKDRLLTAYRLPDFPLFVTVGFEEDAILSNWREQTTLPLAVSGALALAILVIVSLIARQRAQEYRCAERRLAVQKERLDTAINNMPQGLLLFDAAARLVVCNQRYIAMHKLSSDVVRPGCSLRDLLIHRKEMQTFVGDVDVNCSTILDAVMRGQATEFLRETKDGRTIKIVNQPLPAGGWVSTHEDITEQQLVETERDRNRQFLDLIIESVPVPVFVKDAQQRRYVLVNRAAEEFWGIPRTELIGQTAYYMFTERDADLITARDDELIKSGALMDSEREINTPRNGKRLAATTRLTIKGAGDQPKYLIGVIRDTTDRRRLERQRDQNLAFLNTIIETVPVTIVVKEVQNLRYTLVNRAAEKLWGINRDSVIGKTGYEIFSKSTADVLATRDRKLLESRDELVDATHEVDTPGNGKRMVRSKKILIPGEDGEPKYLLGVVEDVTESTLASERIKYMAHHDLLTGLSNRALFMDLVADAIAQLDCDDAVAIFMLDLDRFKEVNDTLGHAAGDELLKEAARRLTECVHETDVLARLGGDEFAIIQRSSACSLDATSSLATRIIDVFANPFAVDGTGVTVGVSIGISLAPIDGADPSDLMKKADLALYRAKSEGRNGYSFFDAKLGTEAVARHHLERDLRAGIFNDELEVYFQPIIHAATRTPCAVEALARWRHPQMGFLSPEQFIPLAEETGLIVPLGQVILQKACAAAAAWPPEIKVAVNISPLQFKKSNLVDVVTTALAEANLPAQRLELEITETVLIDEHLDVLHIIRQLKALGVSIVLDDFGTGYSSLRYLTMFPFDKIKIDKSFTQNLTVRAECAAIVSAVRALAYSLNITVVAEGVETEQHFDLLRASGINEVQGYLFGRPCPLSALRLDYFAGAQVMKKRA